MDNPIVVSSGEQREKVVLPKGRYRIRGKKLDTKEGTDKLGKPVTKIRFYFEILTDTDRTGFVMVSCNARLNPKSYLYKFMSELFPDDFVGKVREDKAATWALAKTFVGGLWEAKISVSDDGQWNNVEVIIDQIKTAPESLPPEAEDEAY